MMRHAHCVLYDPPSSGYPALAVVFASDGQVLATRAVASIGSAEIVWAQLINEIRATDDYVFVIEGRKFTSSRAGGVLFDS